MPPILGFLAAAFGILISILTLANILLVIASLAGRREQALLWLAPLAGVAALFLLGDSPVGSGESYRQRHRGAP